MGGGILVVGAALVDFIGHYRNDGADIRNHAGSVRITIGGAAFNIATNISLRKAAQCCLFSYSPKGSVSAQIIRSVCRSIDLDNKWVSDAGTSSDEPAYVALLCDRALDRGVTSSPIEHAEIFGSTELETAIRRSELVVVETNLNNPQLRILNRLAARYSRPICCMIVSDAKAPRVTGTGFERPFALVSLNSKEAASLGYDITEVSGPNSDRICQLLNANAVIITDGKQGFVVVRSGFAAVRVPAVDNLTIVNELGAGDALFAAACVSILKGEELGSQEANNRILTWTADVLRVEGANLVSSNVVSVEKNRNEGILPGWIALFFGAIVLTFAMIFGVRSAELFWMGFFLSCLFGGVVGGISRTTFSSINGPDRPPNWKVVFLAAAVGFLAALLNASPNLAGELPFATSTKAPSLNWITVGAFISSFIASLAFEAVLAQNGAPSPKAEE